MSHAVLQDILERRLAQKRFRHLQPFTSRPLIDPELNFAHQDLFFLSGHDYIKRKAIEAVGKWGSGFHHTRILLSQLEAQRKVEERLAALLHKKHVFLFNSAESMHETLLSALNHPKMELYIDKYFPLVKGQKKGNTHLFEQDKVLPKTAAGKAIVTTTLSSLTGEFWKEKQILDKAKEQDVVFYVDDSAAFGIYGQLGLGLAAAHSNIDITVIHFQESFGLPVAAVAVSPFFREFFHHHIEPPVPIYPSLLGALEASLELLPALEEERSKIVNSSRFLREELSKKGWNIAVSESHIIPMYLENQQQVKSLCHFLSEEGILVFHFPEKYAASIKLVIHSKHNISAMRSLITSLSKWKEKNCL